jgi:hypothetical protein
LNHRRGGKANYRLPAFSFCSIIVPCLRKRKHTRRNNSSPAFSEIPPGFHKTFDTTISFFNIRKFDSKNKDGCYHENNKHRIPSRLQSFIAPNAAWPPRSGRAKPARLSSRPKSARGIKFERIGLEQGLS